MNGEVVVVSEVDGELMRRVGTDGRVWNNKYYVVRQSSQHSEV